MFIVHQHHLPFYVRIEVRHPVTRLFPQSITFVYSICNHFYLIVIKNFSIFLMTQTLLYIRVFPITFHCHLLLHTLIGQEVNNYSHYQSGLGTFTRQKRAPQGARIKMNRDDFCHPCSFLYPLFFRYFFILYLYSSSRFCILLSPMIRVDVL